MVEYGAGSEWTRDEVRNLQAVVGAPDDEDQESATAAGSRPEVASSGPGRAQ